MKAGRQTSTFGLSFDNLRSLRPLSKCQLDATPDDSPWLAGSHSGGRRRCIHLDSKTLAFVIPYPHA